MLFGCLSLVVVSSSILAAEPSSGISVSIGVTRHSGPDAGSGKATAKPSGEDQTLGQKCLLQQIPRGQGQECHSCGIRKDQTLNVLVLFTFSLSLIF